MSVLAMPTHGGLTPLRDERLARRAAIGRRLRVIGLHSMSPQVISWKRAALGARHLEDARVALATGAEDVACVLGKRGAADDDLAVL